MTDLLKLADYFPPTDIEWRVGQSGKRDDGVWAKVLAYVTNRAIMQRLDDVVGPAYWRNEYVVLEGENKGFLCGLSIKAEQFDPAVQRQITTWVTKWDGAEQTDIESVKGGLSNAMKRAAVQWGIGRYLYDLPEGWAVCSLTKVRDAHYQPANKGKDLPAFYWTPPELPKWALPKAPEPESGNRNGSPPVMGPPKDIVAFTRLQIRHSPNGEGKDFWRIEGDTVPYESDLKRMGWKRKATGAKDWYTDTQSVRDTLEGMLAAPPENLEDMPKVLTTPDPDPFRG